MTVRQILRKIDHFLHPGHGEILMLHRVTEEKSANPYYHRWEISPSFLERTIRTYADKGYVFVSIDDVCTMLKEKKFGKKHFICFTFDDGHLDTYTHALPIMERYSIPFCVYVTPGYVSNDVEAREDEHIPMMSIEQVVQLSRHPLCTIGSHTMSHPHLDNMSYDNQREEILTANDVLEGWIGKPIVHFASPYGSHNAQTLNVVRDLSMTSHVSISGGPVRSNSNLICLPRVELGE